MAVAGNINEDDDLPVWLLTWPTDELNAHAARPVVGGLEVVDA